MFVEPLEDRRMLATFNPSALVIDGAANSLRAAVIAANGNGQNDTVKLSQGTYILSIANTAGQENAALEGDLDLTEAGRSITFTGAGVNKTFIDAETIDRVFQVFSGVTVTFKDLTIRNGRAVDDGAAGTLPDQTDGKGGGIQLDADA